jgi:hypothetical protein
MTRHGIRQVTRLSIAALLAWQSPALATNFNFFKPKVKDLAIPENLRNPFHTPQNLNVPDVQGPVNPGNIPAPQAVVPAPRVTVPNPDAPHINYGPIIYEQLPVNPSLRTLPTPPPPVPPRTISPPVQVLPAPHVIVEAVPPVTPVQVKQGMKLGTKLIIGATIVVGLTAIGISVPAIVKKITGEDLPDTGDETLDSARDALTPP